MNCGILTFHFAHNYGAVLQAYALKNYLNELGQNAFVLDYIPNSMKNNYVLNPLAKDRHPKAVIKRTLKISRRLMQYRLFEDFINTELLNHVASDIDAVICGSDQIWNENITGLIYTYYADEYEANIKRISYAASFGTSVLTEFQKKCIKTYLPGFSSISLRETDVAEEVAELSKRNVVCVLDPVFLLDKENWIDFSKLSKNKTNGRYILYYALRNDKDLIQKTEDISNKMGIPVFCVHPTCNDLKTPWKQLYDVGPYEFVDLLRRAELVSTNSFHAMSFSVIFGKKAIYKAYLATESRVPSLLQLCKAERCLHNGIYNFGMLGEDTLKDQKEFSRNFLNSALL